MLIKLYFSPTRCKWFLEHFGELPHVEVEDVIVLYTDMYHVIEGRCHQEELEDDSMFLGEVEMGHCAFYVPKKYADIGEKNP